MHSAFKNRDIRLAFPGLLGVVDLPPGYVYLTDDAGVFLTTDDGAYLVVAL